MEYQPQFLPILIFDEASGPNILCTMFSSPLGLRLWQGAYCKLLGLYTDGKRQY